MKKTILLLAILTALFLPNVAECQSSKQIKTMAKYEPSDGMLPTFRKIEKCRSRIDRLLKAFKKVESNGNIKAYNKREDSAGVLAIRKIMVDEANRMLRIHDGIYYDYFEYRDRWDEGYSELIFSVIMIHKNPYLDIVRACNVWNRHGGEKYINKIEAAYRTENN